MSKSREILANAYNAAGREFLAYRLTKVLTKIETNDDMALHNDVIAELDVMAGKNVEKLYLDIADLILLYSKKG
jgi:hypothetical protein